LPHTDENFNNQDLGNCLDYTNTPDNNLRPGAYNCERLQGMYGTVGQRRRNRQLLRSPSSTGAGAGDAAAVVNGERREEDTQDHDSSSVNTREEDPRLAEAYDRAMRELKYELAVGNIVGFQRQEQQQQEQRGEVQEEGTEQREEPVSDPSRWRVLRDNPRGGAFVRRLDDNLILEVHVLYPTSSSSSYSQRDGRDDGGLN
jgi:hypothetical protein